MMMRRKLVLAPFLTLILAASAANAGPCNVPEKDAGAGPTPGYSGQTTGTAAPTGQQHPPTQSIWLRERLIRHRGNADVLRQDLLAEKGVAVSRRTLQRAVQPYRQALKAEALATTRFETPWAASCRSTSASVWSRSAGRRSKPSCS
jgi:hypothetical protein